VVGVGVGDLPSLEVGVEEVGVVRNVVDDQDMVVETSWAFEAVMVVADDGGEDDGVGNN